MDIISVDLLFDETVVPSETEIFLLFLYRVNMEELEAELRRNGLKTVTEIYFSFRLS
jgi:hypothetical protein